MKLSLRMAGDIHDILDSGVGYGAYALFMPLITVQPHPEYCPQGATVKASVGTSIAEALLESDIPIEHACGLVCACTTCHVLVRQGVKAALH